MLAAKGRSSTFHGSAPEKRGGPRCFRSSTAVRPKKNRAGIDARAVDPFGEANVVAVRAYLDGAVV